jgi:Ser/Thr protein kinase RdoA (MazF antagonist)
VVLAVAVSANTEVVRETEPERALAGGNVAEGVVRVGATVRKPATPATDSVIAVLEHLGAVGYPAAPRCFGRDAQGRLVLEYVPGAMADTMPPLDLAELHRVGRLIRDLHDALAGFAPPASARWDTVIPPDREDQLCHHDLAPWNLVRDGERWVFIDWDGVGPGSRLWDLGYAAHGFVPLSPGNTPAVDAPRLRALADGYGLDDDQRRELPALTAAHTRAMHDLLVDGARTGRQPWARLHAEGHADHWGPAADYIEAHHEVWVSALTR